MPSIADERARREAMWEQLFTAGGPNEVPPQLLRDLGIYGGAQGVWVDKARTATPEVPDGFAVGLLHTGYHYADDLSEDGVLYHYPKTGRPASRDRGEIEAIRNAATHNVPVFVIERIGAKRTVHRGWVVDLDDESEIALVSFSDTQPSPPDPAPETPFSPTDTGRKTTTTTQETRPGQPKFKFSVLKRYGPKCAVCGYAVPEAIEAAHIIPYHQKGTDDPRNGLPLCVNHHRTHDRYLWAIDPEDLTIRTRPQGPTADELGITRPGLQHLAHSPHKDALEWAWKRWRDQNKVED